MSPKPSEDLPPSGGSTDPVHTGRAHSDDFATELLARLGMRRTPHPRYERLERVAQGGMGTIYRVRDIDLHRDLAMKLLGSEDEQRATQSSTSSIRLARFVEEAQVTGQLDHPGIVPVHELGLDVQGKVYFTMKLVRGRTLRDLLEFVPDEREGWSVTRVLGVLLRVCEAMAYAHSKAVIHRDLKPSNLMVGRFGEVFVMDWGLARVLDRPDPRDVRIREPGDETATQPVLSDRRDHHDDAHSPLYTMDGDVFGTPAYMPPEQARGELGQIGTAADVYAIGAILYHVVSGRIPYSTPGERMDFVEVWRTVKERAPTPLTEVAPHAPEELVAICERAMQRDPRQRYASMSELADDLRAYLENRVVRAHRTGPLVELRKWIVRNRGVAASGALTLLAILAGTLVYAAGESRRADSENLRRVVLAAPELIARAEVLGPTDPRSLPQFEAWVADTQSVLAGRRRHVRALERLRESSRPREVQLDPDPQSRFALENARGWITELERAFREVETNAAAADATEAQREILRGAQAVLPAEIEWWKQREAALAPIAGARVAMQYDDPSLQRRDDELAKLVRELDQLEARTLVDVRARIDRARGLQHETIDEPTVAAAWTEARNSIRDSAQCPDYGGTLDLAPQLGLVPLGRNPASGLWEFWHVLSGERPAADERGGWRIGADTGMVLVLIPGGHVWIGAQRESPDAPFYDPAANLTEKPWECDLAPYFLSKYEMTQGQWSRLTGELPCSFIAGQRLSGDPRITRSNPVESVDFHGSRAVLTRIGLDHPTSAQWERAARGGIDAALGAAALPSVLGRASNHRDSAHYTSSKDPSFDPSDDDGYAHHAPVGTFPPNAWGLHEMLGNVSEWCLDWYGDNKAVLSAPDPATGLRTPDRARKKIARGGDHARVASALRPSALTEMFPDARDYYVGVRPSRSVEPAR